MLVKRLHSFLFPDTPLPRSAQVRFWLSLSLTVAAIYGLMALQDAFSSSYVVQDDARQHIFWMRRFLDPALFPNDLIADYFKSVAPWGFTTFYQAFASVGIDPMLLAKFVPLPLALVAAAYGFGLGMQILPVPFVGFLTSFLIQQVIWTHDDVASATPRAFMPALFLAFLYYLLRRQLFPCLITIALEGLFYPQYVFVFAGLIVLQPLRWERGRVRISQDKQDYWFCTAALAVAVLVMLPYALTASDYGPTITAAAARALPEFQRRGRSSFFSDDTLAFWLNGDRSGIFPSFRPYTLAIGALLPLLGRAPGKFPLLQKITPNIQILPKLMAVGLGLFIVAHVVLFKLHLPSRYTAYTLRYLLAIATAITLAALLEAGLRRLQQPTLKVGQRTAIWGLTILTSAILLIYPAGFPEFPKANYQTGEAPGLYEFFAQQPKDNMIASVLREADNLPSHSQRSILVGREYAIPYHMGYANQFRQRVTDLIQAHYSPDAATARQFMQTYGIDFWLVSREAFTPEFLQDSWLRQYPEAAEQARANLRQRKPFLERQINRCTVFEDSEQDLLVLQADCMMRRAS
ncbi:MAG: hypothetical protein Kow00121_08350 [Elainellaceae cyanobacterium]